MYVARYYVVGCGISVWVETSNERKEGSLPSIGFVHLLSYAQSMATNLSTGGSASCTPIDLTSGGVVDLVKTPTTLATLASSRTGRYPPAASCVLAVLIVRIAEVIATNFVDLAAPVAACPFVPTCAVCAVKKEDWRCLV